jgi:hypothetical protein
MLLSSHQKICILLSFCLALSGCDNILFNSGVDQGIIKYKIDYPDIPKDDYMLDLMPKEMETIFADGEYRSDIIAGMGLFKTSVICNTDQEELIHSVKLLNKKYASNLSKADIKKLNPHYLSIDIKKTGKTKTIAGYECKEALVKMKGDTTWEFKLYYTDKIRIDQPNRHSPFAEIEGVLMEYEMINYDTHMHFVAQQVIEKEVKREDILLEEDYEMVSADKLNKEIEAIFAKVR